MTTLELKAEYRQLVGVIAERDNETLLKAVKALKKILSRSDNSKISKADLVIDSRIQEMMKDIKSTSDVDYREQYYQDYMKGLV
ncbi:MAG: hypothetical protein J6B47_08205 [Prevotella sp.]|nr:hypothetical protein [Prevotella sp.]